MTTKTIERELVEVTNIKPPRRAADRQKFLTAIIETIGDPAFEQHWGDLSKPAQDWYNSVIDDYNAQPPRPLADFSDQEAQSSEEEMAKKNSAKKGGSSKKPASTKSASGAKKKPAGKVAATPVNGLYMITMRKILSKPDITVEDLKKFVATKGSDASLVTLSAIRSRFRMAVNVLKEAGHVKASLEI